MNRDLCETKLKQFKGNLHGQLDELDDGAFELAYSRIEPLFRKAQKNNRIGKSPAKKERDA
jgi:hypothetical protein